MDVIQIHTIYYEVPTLHAMKLKALSLLLPLLVLSGCDQKQKETANTVPPTPKLNAPLIAGLKEKESVRLEISEMGIDNQGYLQLRVHNHTSVQLDLINISWFFYDRNGNQMMKGGYPHSVMTTKAQDGSTSTIVGAGESKMFCNSLIPVQRIFGEFLDGVGDAEVKIYTQRSAFDALNLKSDIECHETTIRQIFQSSRFPLQQAAISSRQEVASRQFTDKEKEVFRYMRGRWDALAASPSGYNPDKHDDLVIGEAATKFRISKDEAKSIYIKVDGAGLDLK